MYLLTSALPLAMLATLVASDETIPAINRKADATSLADLLIRSLFNKRQNCRLPVSNAYCCSSVSYCINGEVCCNNGYCCPGGTTCLEGTFRCSGRGGGFGTGISITTTPRATITRPPTVESFTTILTIRYIAYFLTTIRPTTTVTSTTTSTITSVRVFATASAEAEFSISSRASYLSSFYSDFQSSRSRRLVSQEDTDTFTLPSVSIPDFSSITFPSFTLPSITVPSISGSTSLRSGDGPTSAAASPGAAASVKVTYLDKVLTGCMVGFAVISGISAILL